MEEVATAAKPFADLVQVRASGSFGSGLLVGKGMVLTALHCVAGPERPLKERANIGVYLLRDLQSGKEHHYNASIAWPTIDTLAQDHPDIAILRVDETSAPVPLVRHRFGDIPSSEVVGSARGFPRAASGHQLPGGRIEHNQPGLVAYTSQTKRALTLHAWGYSESRGLDLWAGLSGGPLVINDFVVGVLREVPNDWGGTALVAEPLAPVIEDQSSSAFRDLLSISVPLSKVGGSNTNDPLDEYVRRLLIDLEHSIATDLTISLKFDRSQGIPTLFDESLHSALPSRFIGTTDHGKLSFADLISALDYYGRSVVLLGKPGSGKTTSLLQAAKMAAERRSNDPNQPLPLIAPIATWNSKEERSFSDWICGLSPLLKDKTTQIQEEIRRGNVLFILDGLDELGSTRSKEEAVQQISLMRGFLSAIPPQQSVIVSCRSSNYQEIKSEYRFDGAIEVRDLEPEQIRAALENFDPAISERVLLDPFRSMARSPLMLGAFISVCRSSVDILDDLSAVPEEEIPDRLIEFSIRRRFEREIKRLTNETFVSLQHLYDAFGNIAMFDAGGGGNQNIFSQKEISYHVDASMVDELIHTGKSIGMISEAFEDQFRFSHIALRDHFALHSAMKALEDPTLDESIRDRAAWAVWEIPDRRFVPVLIKATYDERRYVRGSAIGALGRIGDKSAEGRLKELVKDQTPVKSIYGETIGQVAIAALKQLADKE